MGFLFPLTLSFFGTNQMFLYTIDRLQIIECAFIVRCTESLCFNDDAGYLDFSHFNLFETRGRIDARARGLPMNMRLSFLLASA